jgi:hypothetical protein
VTYEDLVGLVTTTTSLKCYLAGGEPQSVPDEYHTYTPITDSEVYRSQCVDEVDMLFQVDTYAKDTTTLTAEKRALQLATQLSTAFAGYQGKLLPRLFPKDPHGFARALLEPVRIRD